jgi:hypothetical protein
VTHPGGNLALRSMGRRLFTPLNCRQFLSLTTWALQANGFCFTAVKILLATFDVRSLHLAKQASPRA